MSEAYQTELMSSFFYALWLILIFLWRTLLTSICSIFFVVVVLFIEPHSVALRDYSWKCIQKSLLAWRTIWVPGIEPKSTWISRVKGKHPTVAASLQPPRALEFCLFCELLHIFLFYYRKNHSKKVLLTILRWNNLEFGKLRHFFKFTQLKSV